MRIFVAVVVMLTISAPLFGQEVNSRVKGVELDFQSLDKFAGMSLSKTRVEALYDMRMCVSESTVLANEIIALLRDFDIKKVPTAIQHTISCVNKCQSFKYLRINKLCGQTVTSAYTNLKANMSLYKLLKDISSVVTAIEELKSDVFKIKDTCIADPNLNEEINLII